MTESIPSVEEAASDISEKVTLLQKMTPTLINAGMKILWAVIIFFIARYIIKWVLKIFDKATNRHQLDKGMAGFLHSFLNVALYVLVVFIICGQLGVNTASIVTLLGSAALAIGLSLQGSLSNFAGSLIILLTHPFRLNDYIILPDGKEGYVRDIGLVYTMLETFNGEIISIPNGTLANTTITNVTVKPVRKLVISVGVSYDADMGKARKILQKAFEEDSRVMKDYPVSSYVDKLDSSAVVVAAYGWLKNDDYYQTKWDLTEKIKNELDKNEISIPYDQLDVHMIQ